RRQHQSLVWSWNYLRRDAAFMSRIGDPRTKRPRPVGSKLTRPALARTLSKIAQQGPQAFYRSQLTERLLEALKPNGLITASDLASYRAKTREPLTFYYRGVQVVTMPPPSAGGV